MHVKVFVTDKTFYQDYTRLISLDKLDKIRDVLDAPAFFS